jgi:hypothetical protein
MTVVTLNLEKRGAKVLREVLSYALSNLDDLNEALDSDVQEDEVNFMLNVLNSLELDAPNTEDEPTE